MIFHIGEAAALMFLAYMLGWAVGYLARRFTARRTSATTAAVSMTEASPQDVPAAAPALRAEKSAVDMAPREAIRPPVVAAYPNAADSSPATTPDTVPAAAIGSPLSAAEPDAPWRALQTWAPLYRPTIPAASQPALPPEDPEDVVMLKRPASAHAAASPATSTSAGPAQRPGVAWFGDINGHPAPPHDTLLGRQAGGPNAVRMAARPQQLTSRPKAPSELAAAADPFPEPPAPILASVPVLEAEAPAPMSEPLAEPVVAASAVAPAVIEDGAAPAMPVVASPPSPPKPSQPEPSQPEPGNVEWEELPSATPVVPPPVRAPRPVYDRPPVISAGRTPAPAVVDADAMLKAMMNDAPASDAEQILPGELVAPPLSELVAKQAPQPAAVRQDPPPAPSMEPAPSKPAETVGDAGKGDEAMNAIEGGWSRRRVRAMADRPEMIDVSAAVAAAQSAVQQVLAQAEPAAGTDHQPPGLGKPPGLQRARDGRRDSLREIIGVTSLDESTLNNLGIFHFDQIADWTDAEVLWLENHVFARGRVGREKWQDQAHKLVLRRPSPPRAARS